jgi:hypothetical protein
MGAPDSFLSPTRLALYATKRNDPGVPQVTSAVQACKPIVESMASNELQLGWAAEVALCV